jgi:hypothetical protein
MTTGRINQVTIFERAVSVVHRPCPLARVGVCHCGGGASTRAPRCPSRERTEPQLPYPRFPTEFSEAGSAKEGDGILRRTLACPPQKEAIRRRSRVKTRLPTRGCSPECVTESMATRQQSTRLPKGGPLASERPSFGCPVQSPKESLERDGRRVIQRDIDQIPSASPQRVGSMGSPRPYKWSGKFG